MKRYRCDGYRRKTSDGKPYCTYESDERWLGRCPSCGRLYNVVRSMPDEDKQKATLETLAQMKPPMRISTGIPEFDKVLGGSVETGWGIVPGSVILVGGERGIGKSTLIMQAATGVAKDAENKVLYVSGEQSAADIAMLASRLGSLNPNVIVLGNEADVYKSIAVAEEEKPKLMVIDSIQTAIIDDAGGDVGSTEQVTAAANYITSFAKSEKVAIFLICHMNKDGDFSGSERMQHLVDSLVIISTYINVDEDGNIVDDNENIREISILGKNRFGDANVKGYLEMTPTGLKPLSHLMSKLIQV